MYPVSQNYKDAVYAPIRNVAARVIFEILDIDAFNDVSYVYAPPGLPYSMTSQLHNQIRTPTTNIATLEPDRFKLDGSFSFADDVDLSANGEVGYVSNTYSDGSNNFGGAMIAISFNENHSSAAISVTFDVVNNEYATDFEVMALDENEELIEHQIVTNNENVICSVLGQFENYRNITIIFNKWSKPYRRLRITEIDFGIIQSYGNDELISVDYIEELDLTSGTVSPSELTFTVDNIDKRFNILNPNGFYRYLQEQQRIVAEIGIKNPESPVYEYVPIGNFLLNEWTSDEGAKSATFKARSVVDVLDNYFYERLTAYYTNLKALAESLFLQAGIVKYSIDNSLASITTNAISKKVTARTLLQMIAIASCSCVYVTRDNVLVIKPLSAGNSTDELNFDNVFKEPKIELEKICRQVNVEYFTTADTVAGVQSASLPNVIQGDVLEVKSNTLINTSARALIVANWVLSQKQIRAKQTADWRYNPALELGDVVEVENSYGTTAQGIITRNEFSFGGALRGKTVTKGVTT